MAPCPTRTVVPIILPSAVELCFSQYSQARILTTEAKVVLEMPFPACLGTVFMHGNDYNICDLQLLFLLQDNNASIWRTCMMFMVSCMKSERSGGFWEAY